MKRLREEIAENDRAIVRLLNRRLELVADQVATVEIEADADALLERLAIAA